MFLVREISAKMLARLGSSFFPLLIFFRLSLYLVFCSEKLSERVSLPKRLLFSLSVNCERVRIFFS